MKEIKKLNDREHILLRPSIYIGSIKYEESEYYLFNLENKKFVKIKVKFNPALIKIFREIFDNSIDEAIRNNFKYGNKIKITLEKDYFIVEDNGLGIHNIKKDGEYQAKIALGYPRAGSNFDENRNSIGINGLGGFLTNCFSKLFKMENKDKDFIYKAEWNNNAIFVKESIKENKTNKTGLKIIVYPDFKRFETNEFTQDDLNIINTQLIMVAISYPKLNIYINENKINIKDFEI